MNTWVKDYTNAPGLGKLTKMDQERKGKAYNNKVKKTKENKASK